MNIIDFERFRFINSNYRIAFEELCYHLFCRKFKQTNGIPADFNEAGLETKPIKHLGKWYGFQAKFFDEKINAVEITNSVEKAIAYFAGQLDVIFIYLNRAKGSKAKYPAKINALASAKGITIEWIEPSMLKAVLVQPNNLDLAQFYFGEADEMGFIYRQVHPRIQTLIQSKAYIDLPVKTVKSFSHLFQELAHSKNKIYLISGNPGSGKSVLTNHLMLEFSGMTLPSQTKMLKHLRNSGSLPMLVNLRECIVSPLEQLIRERLKDYEIKTKNKNIIFIFDGLDELKLEEAEKVLFYCQQLQEAKNTSKIIFSCRSTNQNRFLAKVFFPVLIEYEIDKLEYPHLSRYFSARAHPNKQQKLNDLNKQNPELLKEINDVFLVQLLWDIIDGLDAGSNITDMFSLQLHLFLTDPNFKKNLEDLNLLDPKRKAIVAINKELAFELQQRSAFLFEKKTLQKIILKMYPELDNRSVNHICDYIGSQFFSAYQSQDDELFIYRHRLYQDYFFCLKLRDEYEKNKKVIRPFLSNHSLFESLFLRYLKQSYIKENNLAGLIEINLMDVYLGNNDKYGADEFYYKDSGEFIPAIASLPGTALEALRDDPVLHLEEKLRSSPSSIVTLYRAEKKELALDLLKEFRKQVNDAKKNKNKNEEEFDQLNRLINEQINDWIYIELIIEQKPFKEIFDRCRKASQSRGNQEPYFQTALIQTSLTYSPKKLIAHLQLLDTKERLVLLEQLTVAKYIHLVFTEPVLSDWIRSVIEKIKVNESSAFILCLKIIFNQVITDKEKTLARRILKTLLNEDQFAWTHRKLNRQYTPLAFALDEHHFATLLAPARIKLFLDYELYTGLYRAYVECLQGKKTVKSSIADFLKYFELKTTPARSNMSPEISLFWATVFIHAPTSDNDLAVAKLKLFTAETALQATTFFKEILRHRPELLSRLLNEEDIEQQIRNLQDWNGYHSDYTDHCFELAQLYALYSTEKSIGFLSKGINNGILRHGYRKDTIISHGLIEALEVCWKHNWFPISELKKMTQEVFDLTLRLNHITDGKGTWRAPFHLIESLTTYNVELSKDFINQIKKQTDRNTSKYLEYLSVLTMIESGEEFDQVVKQIQLIKPSYSAAGVATDHFEFRFALYTILSGNGFYTAENKKTAYDSAKQAVADLGSDISHLNWVA